MPGLEHLPFAEVSSTTRSTMRAGQRLRLRRAQSARAGSRCGRPIARPRLQGSSKRAATTWFAVMSSRNSMLPLRRSRRRLAVRADDGRRATGTSCGRCSNSARVVPRPAGPVGAANGKLRGMAFVGTRSASAKTCSGGGVGRPRYRLRLPQLQKKARGRYGFTAVSRAGARVRRREARSRAHNSAGQRRTACERCERRTRRRLVGGCSR